MTKKICIALLMVVSLFAINANGAPMAYSVNSDAWNLATEDRLYAIDLATGIEQARGELYNGIENRRDTEGLAFDRDGNLWGIDDLSMTLFPINKVSGAISFLDEKPLTGFPEVAEHGGNDFGMTFTCDNTLYVTSVATQTLYQLDMDGTAHAIGPLGVNISAIAATGSNPIHLYGLGNGEFLNGDTDSPNLYRIDINTGFASLIGPLGGEISEYAQGGLSFDDNGDLWAITDRRTINEEDVRLPSQIMRIDMEFGTATLIWSTSEVGFESLAIDSQPACSASSGLVDEYEPIPALSPTGRLLAIFVVLLAGFGILNKRIS